MAGKISTNLVYASVLVLFLLFSACQEQVERQQVQQFTCWDGSVVTDLANCPANVPPEPEPPAEVPEPEPQPTTDDPYDIFRTDENPTASVTGEVANLQSRAEAKTIKGYSFVYTEINPATGLQTKTEANGKHIYIRDGKIAFNYLKREFLVASKLYVNWIVADEDMETGTAWCSDRCPSQEKFNMDVSDFRFVSPKYWIDNLEDAEQVGEQLVRNVPSVKIQARVDNQDVIIFVHNFYGLPVEVRTPQVTYIYEQLTTTVSNSIFEPPEA